jgi:hypothetical protein
MKALPKTAANEHNKHQLDLIASNIGGTTEQLKRQLAKIEAGALGGAGAGPQTHTHVTHTQTTHTHNTLLP